MHTEPRRFKCKCECENRAKGVTDRVPSGRERVDGQLTKARRDCQEGQHHLKNLSWQRSVNVVQCCPLGLAGKDRQHCPVDICVRRDGPELTIRGRRHHEPHVQTHKNATTAEESESEYISRESTSQCLKLAT